MYNPLMNKPIERAHGVVDTSELKGRVVVLQNLTGHWLNPIDYVTGIQPLSPMHAYGKFDDLMPEKFFSNTDPSLRNKGLLVTISPKEYSNKRELADSIRAISIACGKHERWAFVVVNDDHYQTEMYADIVFRVTERSTMRVIKNRLGVLG